MKRNEKKDSYEQERLQGEEDLFFQEEVVVHVHQEVEEVHVHQEEVVVLSLVLLFALVEEAVHLFSLVRLPKKKVKRKTTNEKNEDIEKKKELCAFRLLF